MDGQTNVTLWYMYVMSSCVGRSVCMLVCDLELGGEGKGGGRREGGSEGGKGRGVKRAGGKGRREKIIRYPA